MTKIMLVEDDKSLREIYGVRLLAEGYDIVSAGDGEEALAMAIKERPQLIVSDVMMPKISGFDMLDILRSTTETKNIKVIMMTALSSEEQRTRGESLGADRYLVKSQVGIEDVVRVVHEVLNDQTAPAATAAAAPAPVPTIPAPVQTQPAAQITTPAAPAPPRPPAPVAMPTPLRLAPAPVAAPGAPATTSTAPKPPSQRARIIQPLNDPSQSSVNLNDLLDKELAKEANVTDSNAPAVASTAQEKAVINEQLAGFTPPGTQTPATGSTGVPEINISEDGSLTPETVPAADIPRPPAPAPPPAA